PQTCDDIAQEIKDVKALGIQLAIVIGGGNIFRGLAGEKHGLDRTTGDYMGMLATVINALALQNSLEKAGVPSRVLSAIEMLAVHGQQDSNHRLQSLPARQHQARHLRRTDWDGRQRVNQAKCFANSAKLSSTNVSAPFVAISSSSCCHVVW